MNSMFYINLVFISFYIGLFIYCFMKINGTALNENCENKLVNIYLINLVFSIIGEVLTLLLQIRNSQSEYGYSISSNPMMVLLILSGLLGFILNCILFFKIDEKLTYNLTNGKLGIAYVVLSILGLLISFIGLPLSSVIQSILHFVYYSKLSQNGSLIPSTQSYTLWLKKAFIFLGINGIVSVISSLINFSYMFTENYTDIILFSNIFSYINRILSYIGFVYLGYGLLLTSQVPLVTAKNRSIYTSQPGYINEPNLNSGASNYQFGAPRPSIINPANTTFNSSTTTILSSSTSDPSFCNKCGKMLASDAQFCPNCGQSR
ncbi:hypothetical protein WKT22_05123 [Candidatus Lokiarchaeum ossiferum]